MTVPLPCGYERWALRAPTLPPAHHINAYLIGSIDALIVDPGSPYPGEQRRLHRRLYQRLGEGGSFTAVLLTHHHRDHIAGAAATARHFQLPLWAHRETLRRLGPALQSCRQRALDDGNEIIVDENRNLVALHTPGHAPGHLCLFEPTSRTLISGDNVLGAGTTLIDPRGGDMASYLASLQRLTGLGPDRVLPAHGPVLGEGRAHIEALIAHRLEREHKVLQALDETRPRSLSEIARRAYPGLAPWLFALAQRSTLAHLRKLQVEGSATAGAAGFCRSRH